MRLQSKPAQLAEYLRTAIRGGSLGEPLPGMRVWSRELGVSRRTLQTALQTLQREGLLTMHARGARLASAPVAAKPDTGPRRMRWLIDGTY
ncbi:MAG: GntR family transcriptional regulator, partial [Cephaloticoccus sp.]|nr:GntR family transcriptional regulator [Cephaloticoccus sp.]